jgi:hypothetical protein
MAFHHFTNLLPRLQERIWRFAIPPSRPNAQNVSPTIVIPNPTDPDHPRHGINSILCERGKEFPSDKWESVYDDTGRPISIPRGLPDKAHIGLARCPEEHPHPERIAAIHALLGTCQGSRHIAIEALDQDDTGTSFGLFWPMVHFTVPGERFDTRGRRVDGSRDLILPDSPLFWPHNLGILKDGLSYITEVSSAAFIRYIGIRLNHIIHGVKNEGEGDTEEIRSKTNVEQNSTPGEGEDGGESLLQDVRNHISKRSMICLTQ